MITSSCSNTLRNRSTPKLRGPNDQCVIEHPALLQILQQCRYWLVHTRCLASVVFDDAFMRIPVDTRRPKRTTVVQLHKPHTLLSKPSCKETITPKASRLRLVQTVHRLNMRRLRLNINRLRNTHLHPCRELICLDTRCDSRFIRMLTMKAIVQIAQQSKPSLTLHRIHGGRWEEVVDSRALGLKRRPLMCRREKATGPVNGTAGRKPPRVWQNNKCRKVTVERTKPIRQPCPHAGKAINGEAAVHLERRRRVVRRLGFHAVQPSNFVGDIS